MLATIQFIQNRFNYPDYTETLTSWTNEMECTPVGLNLKGGSIRVAGDFYSFLQFNYIKFTRGDAVIYAWVDNVEYKTETLFDIHYSTDSFRTYKDKIVTGSQYIERSPRVTNKLDTLLGANTDVPSTATYNHTWDNHDKRIMVVQVKLQSGGDLLSNVPVQPSQYMFHFCEYDIHDWYNNVPLRSFIESLSLGATPINIGAIYSIPYIDTTTFSPGSLPIDTGKDSYSIPGWLVAGFSANFTGALSRTTPINFIFDKDVLLRSKHSVRLVIPEAGIMDITDDLLIADNLHLRQDIDLFSGSSNYMLVKGDTGYSTQSIRGSSIASISIIGDPLETYLSQNQNSLFTQILGDTANVVVGMGTAMTGNPIGVSQAMNGATSLLGEQAKQNDIGNTASNPPAFLGTAMANEFNSRFWIHVTRTRVDNAELVNSLYGYPEQKIAPLTIPSSGFIQTKGCSVSSNGSIPGWAISEINTIFDNGLRVRA